MASKASVDSFTNRLIGDLTMSAANTWTDTPVEIGVSLFQQVALLVNRVEFRPALSTLAELAAAGDSLTMMFTSYDPASMPALTDPRIYLYKCIETRGAATTLIESPLVLDLADLPGGGILIPPRPLYFGVISAGFAAAATVAFQLYYTVKELSKEDYLELIQSSLNAAL